jgi:oxygen-independent coproporphyrinogen-3 oxidase
MTPLSPAEQADEALLMGLRLSEGLDLDRLAAVGGLVPAAAAIDELIGLDLLEWCAPRRLRAARGGRFVLNEIVLRLASALEPAGRLTPVS